MSSSEPLIASTLHQIVVRSFIVPPHRVSSEREWARHRHWQLTKHTHTKEAKQNKTKQKRNTFDNDQFKCRIHRFPNDLIWLENHSFSFPCEIKQCVRVYEERDREESKVLKWKTENICWTNDIMFAIPKLGDESDGYDGSRMFTWLADICGLSVDLVSTYLVMLITNTQHAYQFIFEHIYINISTSSSHSNIKCVQI